MPELKTELEQKVRDMTEIIAKVTFEDMIKSIAKDSKQNFITKIANAINAIANVNVIADIAKAIDVNINDIAITAYDIACKAVDIAKAIAIANCIDVANAGGNSSYNDSRHPQHPPQNSEQDASANKAMAQTISRVIAEAMALVMINKKTIDINDIAAGTTASGMVKPPIYGPSFGHPQTFEPLDLTKNRVKVGLRYHPYKTSKESNSTTSNSNESSVPTNLAFTSHTSSMR